MVKLFCESVGVMKIYVMVKTKYILPIGMNNTTALWERCDLTHVSTWNKIHRTL